ncbi:hypothetical protein Tco_1385493 [Tanacetum coccineum]
MKNMMKALVPTPVPIKAVEERCTTCGSNHSYKLCPMTRGAYDYPVYHDNFQQFQQATAVGGFVQGNSGHSSSSVACYTRPPGFTQPNLQASRPNQGYMGNKGYNRTRFEAYTKANDATLTNLQKNLNDFKREQQDFQNEQRNFQNMMLNMFQKQMGNNNASDSGTLPNNVMARKHEVTKTNVQPESSQSTANVQPRVDHGKGKDKLKDDELEKKKDDFPSRNDESILKEEVHKETLKSYFNPLFEDDEEIISIEVSRQISPKVNSEPSIESLPKDDFDNDDDLFGWILTI